jgi:ribosomal-protein-serine acetyltransferase
MDLLPCKVDSDIILLPPEDDLAPTLMQMVDDQRIYLERWLPWVSGNRTIADAENFLKNARRFNIGGQQFNAVISYQGSIAGCISFNRIDSFNRVGEIGYWLSNDLQGRGVITRSCRALIYIGFTMLNLQRIEILTATQNIRSRRIPERLGFTLEGILKKYRRVDSHYHDMCLYAMLLQEWEKLRT